MVMNCLHLCVRIQLHVYAFLYTYTCMHVHFQINFCIVNSLYLAFQGRFELRVQPVWYLCDPVWQRNHVAGYAYHMHHCPHT